MPGVLELVSAISERIKNADSDELRREIIAENSGFFEDLVVRCKPKRSLLFFMLQARTHHMILERVFQIPAFAEVCDAGNIRYLPGINLDDQDLFYDSAELIELLSRYGVVNFGEQHRVMVTVDLAREGFYDMFKWAVENKLEVVDFGSLIPFVCTYPTIASRERGIEIILEAMRNLHPTLYAKFHAEILHVEGQYSTPGICKCFEALILNHQFVAARIVLQHNNFFGLGALDKFIRENPDDGVEWYRIVFDAMCTHHYIPLIFMILDYAGPVFCISLKYDQVLNLVACVKNACFRACETLDSFSDEHRNIVIRSFAILVKKVIPLHGACAEHGIVELVMDLIHVILRRRQGEPDLSTSQHKKACTNSMLISLVASRAFFISSVCKRHLAISRADPGRWNLMVIRGYDEWFKEFWTHKLRMLVAMLGPGMLRRTGLSTDLILAILKFNDEEVFPLKPADLKRFSGMLVQKYAHKYHHAHIASN